MPMSYFYIGLIVPGLFVLSLLVALIFYIKDRK